MKNKPLFYLFLVFSIINIIDLVTAMFILPGESNPLYLLFKSSIPLIILKLFLIVLVYFFYIKGEFPSEFWYYTFIYILVMGIFLFGFGVFSNVYGIINPRVVDVAANMETAVKLSYYKDIILFFAVIPYAFSSIAFKFYINTKNNIRYVRKKNGIKYYRN